MLPPATHRLLTLATSLVLGVLPLQCAETTETVPPPVAAPNAQRGPGFSPEILLQEGLKRYPEADTDHDGKLTIKEAKLFMQQRGLDKSALMPGKKADTPEAPPPTFADVSYGPRERNKLDFWRATSNETAAPLVIFIHGGGFVKGDKQMWRNNPVLEILRKDGFACAALNYPFQETIPIQDILHDIARAVQFLRSKAGEWNLDKNHFAGWGGSAGAGSSLWLDTRDDLADPANADPVLRESSRLQAAVLSGTQATYNVTLWDAYLGPPKPEWMTSPTEFIDFYHFKSEEEAKTPAGLAVLDECDMLKWIGPGDGPLFIIVNKPDGEPQDRGHWLHHPRHAEEVRKACEAAGIPCTVNQKGGDPSAPIRFLEKYLRAGKGPL